MSGGSKIETTPKRHQPTDHGHSEHEKSFSVNSSPASEHRDSTNGPYPDIIDIAGMDYTPATGKTPIHNWMLKMEPLKNTHVDYITPGGGKWSGGYSFSIG